MQQVGQVAYLCTVHAVTECGTVIGAALRCVRARRPRLDAVYEILWHTSRDEDSMDLYRLFPMGSKNMMNVTMRTRWVGIGVIVLLLVLAMYVTRVHALPGYFWQSRLD